VQFASMAEEEGTARVDAGFYSPSFFEERFASLVTPCYVAGDPLLEAPEDFQNITVAEMDAVVAFPYGTSGIPEDPQYIPPALVSLMGEVGTVWGLAYDDDRFQLYQSAFLKRHSGLGPLGLGGIYLTDLADGYVTTPFVDLADLGVEVGSIGERDLTYVVGQQNRDAGVFPLVAKVGLGDIDISPDGTALYVMNLFEKEVIELDTQEIAITNRFDIPEVDCTLGEIRPFALKIDDQNNLWAGAVCSAESGGTREDLSAHVFRVSVDRSAAEIGPFEEILAFELSRFNRGIVNGSLDAGDWNPWTDVWQQNFNSYPIPVFSDIEIDEDGSLIMAFFDRTGHNTGQNQLHPQTDDVLNFTSGGDILRACLVDGEYVIEGTAGICDYNFVGDGDGLDGDEYYIGAKTNPHFETGLGSLAFVQGSGEVAATVYSPIQYSTAGISWMDNVDGSERRDYQVYEADPIYFGKLNGLGDLEVINLPAPHILSSRLWIDENGNGLQDVNESILDGVTVELVEAESELVISSVVTDRFGEYLFSSGPGVGASHAQFQVPMRASKTYMIRIKEGQSVYNAYDLTQAYVINRPGDEMRNSNGEEINGLYQSPVEVTSFSPVSASLGFGFVAVPIATGGSVGVDIVTDFEETPPGQPAAEPTVEPVEAGDSNQSSDDVEAADAVQDSENSGTEIAVIPAAPVASVEVCATCPTETPAGRSWLQTLMTLFSALAIGALLGWFARGARPNV
ncbi:MAG: SdrD B-like domain-containing protein, partial [Chloroflexota bacterium]